MHRLSVVSGADSDSFGVGDAAGPVQTNRLNFPETTRTLAQIFNLRLKLDVTFQIIFSTVVVDVLGHNRMVDKIRCIFRKWEVTETIIVFRNVDVCKSHDSVGILCPLPESSHMVGRFEHFDA
eukprot:Lithocolla_globosa_v1_NODE_2601_length_1938_cov_11.432820.p3 type:complete len:123 gc:universal NODE_2601_length_1938_cov_11.432820:793-425(-)